MFSSWGGKYIYFLQYLSAWSGSKQQYFNNSTFVVLRLHKRKSVDSQIKDDMCTFKIAQSQGQIKIKQFPAKGLHFIQQMLINCSNV